MKCVIGGCMNVVHKDKLCTKHRKQKRRKTDPIAHAYTEMREKAKRSKTEFRIEKTEFREFCKRHSSTELKRINTGLCYDIDNLIVKKV